MPVLVERKTWKKERPSNETRRSDDLTPEEHARVRAALRFLRTRLGGAAKLATALKVNCKLVDTACAAKGRPSAGLAIRAARVAGVPVEEVLRGGYPPVGACPLCGHGLDP